VQLGGNVKAKDAEKAFKVMQEGDVLFIDEMHHLVSQKRTDSEWLLTVMQDGQLTLPEGTVQVPDVTVIGATTDGQKLPKAVLERFKIKPILVEYTEAEALQIAKLTAERNDFGGLIPMPENSDWLVAVTKACARNPRRMDTLLGAVRDSVLAGRTQDGPNGYDISTALKWNGLTEDGLDKLAQEYLVGLWVNGGSSGIASIKALLSTEQIKHTEDDLIRRGYVHVTASGRQLTDFGQERALTLAQQIMTNMEEAA
jgi:Holliday junction resolvasome RuvABC ATP-dependent DNA helicase subunit